MGAAHEPASRSALVTLVACTWAGNHTIGASALGELGEDLIAREGSRRDTASTREARWARMVVMAAIRGRVAPAVLTQKAVASAMGSKAGLVSVTPASLPNSSASDSWTSN